MHLCVVFIRSSDWADADGSKKGLFPLPTLICSVYIAGRTHQSCYFCVLTYYFRPHSYFCIRTSEVQSYLWESPDDSSLTCHWFRDCIGILLMSSVPCHTTLSPIDISKQGLLPTCSWCHQWAFSLKRFSNYETSWLRISIASDLPKHRDLIIPGLKGTQLVSSHCQSLMMLKFPLIFPTYGCPISSWVIALISLFKDC